MNISQKLIELETNPLRVRFERNTWWNIGFPGCFVTSDGNSSGQEFQDIAIWRFPSMGVDPIAGWFIVDKT